MKTQKNTFENFPEWIIERWQDIADILAESIGIPAALVMKTEDDFMEVFISSQSENNPYHVGDKEKRHGLYCETVIKSQNKLSITNALKDKNWDQNPDIKLGMIAYLGFPLNFPNGQPFGTICILDNKENPFATLYEKILLQFKNVIELDLALIQTFDIETKDLAKTIKDQQSQLSSKNIELQKAKEKAEESAQELKAKNEELRQINDELVLAKEKAVESDRLKSAFLANMSHEIRTPMNGILGFAQLLKEPNLTGEQQQEYIRIIEKGGARMLNIINDIVDISKIESGQMKVSVSKTNVNDQIEFLHNFFKTEAENKGLQLLNKTAKLTKGSIIYTDREKLYAILTNLIKNAIKYSDKGTIEFGYDSTSSPAGQSELTFFVKDSGIGIARDRQEAIFERFIQADISDKMARHGAGLGLSISNAYSVMLGGKIWVESQEGIGSTFYFSLPYRTEEEEKRVVDKVVPSQNEKNQIKDLKILIAEDDEASEMLISINVSKFSKGVLKARTGNEAIEICRTNSDLDLILMDIQMPDLNGREATRQIRQFNKDVVIIAQTAYGLSGDREKAIEAGCNDYISKPINKDELHSLIQKYFKN